MSESKPWWKARDQSLMRKAAAKSESNAKLGDSFLIVTEGTVTEPIYFDLLLKSLHLSTVTVKVIPGKASDPRQVIQSAADEVKALAQRVKRKKLAVNELESFNHIWAVFDTDVAVRNNIWNDVTQKARDLKVNVAHSSPCFEYWLLLHLKMTTRSDLIDGSSSKKIFCEELGSDYSTNCETTERVFKKLIPNWPTAVKNAEQVRQLHEEGKTPTPANPSTEIDRLVCALNDSTLPHLRKNYD